MATKKKNKEKIIEEKYNGPSVILITGAAGYVGAMLCDQFSACPDVKEIIAIDKEEMPELLDGNKKIHWITSELSSGGWQKEAILKEPEVVIHCAWQIKELYGEKEEQRKLNKGGTENVFDFVFKNYFVKKLIHFSSISSYGAFDNNTKEKFFMEGDILREDEYLYGIEKKEAETDLARRYSESDRSKKIFIVRPATIRGPRACEIKKEGLLHMISGDALPFLPVADDDWGRQYIHEDDMTDIVGILAFNNVPGRYEVFNLAPSDLILAKDFSEIYKKKKIHVPSFIIRIIFFFVWHVTQGKISTGKGAWKYFSYPIFADGTKVVKFLKYPYNYSSKEVLTENIGRYKKAE